MNKIKKFISCCCVTALALPLTAVTPPAAAVSAPKLLINEVCAKNTSYAAPDGNYYDWIEIYNPTSQAVDLAGYGLSDKASKPYKYTFPAGSSIDAGQRIIVFCDSLIPEMPGQYTAAFGLSTNGETLTLTSPDGSSSDTITFGIMETNVTYGRVPDGSDDFAFMAMTPAAPNEKNTVIAVDVPEPEFSVQGGFYDSPFDLTINVPADTTVYYTLDGSTPDTSSATYISPISVNDPTPSQNKISAITNIIPPSMWGDGATAPREPVDKAFIVNAVAVDGQGNASDTVSAAYFIGYANKPSYYQNMKVISLTTDNENLFDHEKGIYVLGKVFEDWRNDPSSDRTLDTWNMPANYNRKGAEWERPATIQIYKDGKLAHSQNVGIRIHGGATRSESQKSFNVYARSDYGATKLDFDLYSGELRSEATGKKIKEFDSFMLRNSGNDCQGTRFRDKLNQELVSDRDILTQAMQPAVVFINGEFWGHYEITEKLDEDFVDAHYKVGKKNVCIIKNENLDEGDPETFEEWKQLRDWVKTTDLSNDENYRQLCEKIDMQSFADYVSAEIYFNNWDWGENNTAMWKSTAIDPENPWSDGKWRFILFDTEYSLNIYNNTPPNTDSFRQLTEKKCFLADLLKNAVKNEEFRQQLCITFMDMANYNFNTNRITERINGYDSVYRDLAIDTMYRFWASWNGKQGNVNTYNDQLGQVKSFYQSRYQSAASHLKNFAGLNGQLVSVSVINDDSKGKIAFNTIEPDTSMGIWTGKYYTDFPVTITAQPELGYKFSHWIFYDDSESADQTIEVSFTRDFYVTAVYEEITGTRGDVNLDGKTNIADVVMLQRYLLGREKLDAEMAENADVLADKVIDVYDLVALRQIILGKSVK